MSLTKLVQRTAISLAALFLGACSQAPHSVEEKYVLVVANTKSPYWEQVTKGLNQAARELSVSASLAGPDSFNPAVEKQEFKRILAQKPAVISI